MRRYLRLKIKLRILLFTYLLIALLAPRLFVSAGGELFPFFNGRWFQTVPKHVADYGLLIQSIDGTRLDPPAYFELVAPDRFPGVRRFDAYYAIQKLGRTLESGEEANAIVGFVGIMPGKSRKVEYQVHKRKYVVTDLKVESG